MKRLVTAILMAMALVSTTAHASDIGWNANATAASYFVGSTAYCGKEPGQTVGSKDNKLRSGKDIAMYRPYNSMVYVSKSPTGRHWWRVRDKPGGTELDFFVSCNLMNKWGRRSVKVRFK